MNMANKRRVKLVENTQMYLDVYPDHVGKPGMVTIEGPEEPIDMSPKEAIDLAAALTWAANGGHQGRSGT